MRMFTVLFFTLISGSAFAFAANDHIKTCQGSDSVEIQYANNQVTSTIVSGPDTKVLVFPAKLANLSDLDVTAQDLLSIRGSNNQTISVVAGVVYELTTPDGREFMYIANDAQGVQYLAGIAGPYIYLTGASNTCP